MHLAAKVPRYMSRELKNAGCAFTRINYNILRSAVIRSRGEIEGVINHN